jgi:hypothetical protein
MFSFSFSFFSFSRLRPTYHTPSPLLAGPHPTGRPTSQPPFLPLSCSRTSMPPDRHPPPSRPRRCRSGPPLLSVPHRLGPPPFSSSPRGAMSDPHPLLFPSWAHARRPHFSSLPRHEGATGTLLRSLPHMFFPSAPAPRCLPCWPSMPSVHLPSTADPPPSLPRRASPRVILLQSTVG